MATPAQTRFNVCVIGDDCVDQYQYGTVDRISPEAPVPVFRLAHAVERPGMAGNVADNLRALGCGVDFIPGAASRKTRLIDSRSNQHIVRVDLDAQALPLQLDTRDLNQYHAVVISDYDKGAVTYELIEAVRDRFSGPVFLDTKKTDLAAFHGIYVKINEAEYNRRVSINHSLIVTLGERGAMYKTGRDPRHETYFDCPKVEIVDVTGAGDTFLAALAFDFLRSTDIHRAIAFAIQASAITVQHLGCHAPGLEEISWQG